MTTRTKEVVQKELVKLLDSLAWLQRQTVPVHSGIIATGLARQRTLENELDAFIGADNE